MSFFTFCWWFCCMNIFNFLLILLFLVIPQTIYNKSFINQNFYGNSSYTDTEFSLLNILSSKGWFTNSSFYYAGYTNRTFEVIPGFSYNIPKAYLVTVIMIFLLNFIAIMLTFVSYFDKKEAIGDGGKYLFSREIFSHWDYATGVQAVADYMKSSFCEEMRGLLRKETSIKTESLWTRVYKISVSMFINLSVFIFVVGSCASMLSLLKMKYLKNYHSFMVSTMLTVVPFVFYYFLKSIECFEVYFTKKTALRVSMVRLLFLRISLMAIVFYFWADVFEENDAACNQTELSASLFRLIVGNFCVQIFLCTFIAEYMRRKMIDMFGFKWDKCHFDLAYHVVDIMHCQFLTWSGLLWVPLMPLLNIVYLYILLFLKANSVLDNCIPALIGWTSEEADKLFLKLTMATFACSVVFSGYSLLRMGNTACGPFRVWDEKVKLFEQVLRWKPYTTSYSAAFSYYFSYPVFFFVVFIISGTLLARVRAYASSEISLAERLEEELRVSYKDNTFLLHSLNEVLNKRNELDENFVDSVSDSSSVSQ